MRNVSGPRAISSTVVPLCRREVGARWKEKRAREDRKPLFPLPIVTRALTFITIFLSVSQRETAKERILHTILGFPLRDLTACDLRKNDVTNIREMLLSMI